MRNEVNTFLRTRNHMRRAAILIASIFLITPALNAQEKKYAVLIGVEKASDFSKYATMKGNVPTS